MMRSLYSGVSGLKTHQTKMDVIGNNIANVNTASFKSQSITFSELMYQTTQAASGANPETGRAGTNARQIGLGVKTGAISTSIETAGATQSTGNPFDIKITGEALFIVSNGQDTFFTRDGSFYVDGQGNLAIVNTYVPTEYEYLGGDFMDIEWEFINGGIETKSIQDYIKSSSQQKDSIVTIAVCLPDPGRALAAALYFDREIYSHVSQILVYNRYSDALVRNMNHHEGGKLNPYQNKLRPFGMASCCYDSQIITDAEYIGVEIGKEYDKIYSQEENVNEGKTLGKSQVAKWWSNLYAANTMWTKLRSLRWEEGKTIEDKELDILANAEHGRWNMEQLLIGYRPLTETEQNEVLADISLKGPKKSEMAHLDICSCERLEEIDARTIKFDTGLTKILPEIYKSLSKK
jgi:flagellar basal body rod protein FlgB